MGSSKAVCFLLLALALALLPTLPTWARGTGPEKGSDTSAYFPLPTPAAPGTASNTVTPPQKGSAPEGFQPVSGRLSSLEEIEALAREKNLEYRKALLTAKRAASALEDALPLSKTFLSFSAQYGKTSDPDFLGYSASVSLPLLEQLGVSGRIDQDSLYQLGLSVNPLYHSDSSRQLALAYRKALLQVEDLSISVGKEARQSALAWMTSLRKSHYQEELAALRKAAYEDEQVKYKAGESTLEDVRESFISWSQAETALIDIRQKTRQAETNLHLTLNSDPSTVRIDPLSLEELYKALTELQTGLDPEDGDYSGQYSVIAARLEAESAKAKYDSTWLISPSLSITANINPDPAGNPAVSGSATLNISVQDWKGAEKEQAREELALAREAALISETRSRLDLLQSLAALDIAQQTRKIRELELEQAKILAEEADFLHSLGRISRLEQWNTLLTLKAAENELFSALAEEYSAWLSIKRFL